MYETWYFSHTLETVTDHLLRRERERKQANKKQSVFVKCSFPSITLLLWCITLQYLQHQCKNQRERDGEREVLPGKTSRANTHDRTRKHAELYILPIESVDADVFLLFFFTLLFYLLIFSTTKRAFTAVSLCFLKLNYLSFCLSGTVYTEGDLNPVQVVAA